MTAPNSQAPPCRSPQDRPGTLDDMTEWENLVATIHLADYDDCTRLTDHLYEDGRPWVCTVEHKAPQHHVVVATIPLDHNDVPGDNYAPLVQRVLDVLRGTRHGGRATFQREHVIEPGDDT